MIDLVEQATILAHDIDKPFDFALKRRLIATFTSGRAMLLRRSIVRNGHIPEQCIQSAGVPIIKADTLSAFYIDNYKVSMKSKETVPNPIRTGFDTPFISVTSLDGSINFAFADLPTVRFNSHAGKFVKGTGRYIYHQEYIGVYHNEGTLLASPMLMVRAVYENPLAVRDYSGNYTYSETNYPMPLDMAVELRQLILKGELAIIPETQEITINDDK